MLSENPTEGPTTRDISELTAIEALQRLELFAELSRVLDNKVDDYEEVARRVISACVGAFADLCAVELIGQNGQPYTVAYQVRKGSGLTAPRRWEPLQVSYPSDGPILGFHGHEQDEAIARVRRTLGAESVMLVPITGGGITVGCFLAATGPDRRSFRPSALRIGKEVASRLAGALDRSTLHREMATATSEQARAVRRLRRLATAAAKLAGAATTQEVLKVACTEARAIQEAHGAMARWWMPDGSMVEAQSGHVDKAAAERAFGASGSRRVARGVGWVSYPFSPNHVGRRASMVVLGGRELSNDEELVLTSLASLVPVAFERAVGTGAALAQQARVRAVVSSSPVALVGLGPGASVTLANPAAKRLFAWPDGDGPVVVPPSLQAAFAELADSVQQGGQQVTRVVSAEPFELSLSAAPLPVLADGGDELSVLVAATDLSEVRRAERALVQAQRLEAMGLVAGRVAHDFNNLLTVIIGYTEILGRSHTEEAKELAVSNISRAARRAASLTQQLLGLTRVQRDAATAVDLAAELRGLLPVLERLAGGGVVVRTECPDHEVMVNMSPTGAEQVILNLALNACQALQQGGVITIRLSVDGQPGPAPTGSGSREGLRSGWAVFSVIDDGAGMTEEVRGHCLEPFFTTKERMQGTGLGLPTVHALVTEGGGHLEIDSAPGEGTEVSVRLPLSEGVPTTEDDEAVRTWPAGEVLAGRALLVEDQDDIRDLAARALGEAGLEVVSAGDAEMGAQMFEREGPFDILVTDVMLPRRSGIDLARELMAGEKGFPVLFVTGSSEQREPVATPGAYRQVLRKPYRPEELVFAVAALLGGEQLDPDGPVSPAPKARSGNRRPGRWSASAGSQGLSRSYGGRA